MSDDTRSSSSAARTAAAHRRVRVFFGKAFEDGDVVGGHGRRPLRSQARESMMHLRGEDSRASAGPQARPNHLSGASVSALKGIDGVPSIMSFR